MISDLILIAKKFSVPSAYGRSDGVRDFFAQYPDGVYIATDAGAPAGWEGYAVWFGGAGERYAERFMEFIRDGYIVERFLRARVGGLLVFTFRCRLKMRRFGTLGKPYGGASPLDKWWGLKLTIPDGGTVILRKNGSPTAVNLEVSTDAVHWSAWTLSGTDYTYALTAGQTLCIRNTSETVTGFSIGLSSYYGFYVDNDYHAYGNINSLISKREITDTQYSLYEFYSLFARTPILSAPELPNTLLYGSCYRAMFYGCNKLVKAPVLPATSVPTYAYFLMFQDCSLLNEVTTLMTTIEDSTYSLFRWLRNVAATGDFYCPASLTIPSGDSGIPSGWTRHDINDLNH